ncbi:MAG: hypothetical protein LQ350_000621 [Teloschistes chrysophthalmus]|nr:MAG: hypothetical protein LQ350_000621 [Niorma chrysophthalma]
MATKDKPTYQPQDAISQSLHSTMILGGTGLFVSAVQNTLTRQNVSAWGVVTRTGSTIWTFAAIGGVYEFTRTAAANLREKNDAYNNAIGGFFGGGVVGLRCIAQPPLHAYTKTKRPEFQAADSFHCVLARSLPAMIGFGAALSLAQFAFEFTGGKFSGFAQDAEVDEYERKEQLRRNRRRPIEQTLQEMGEGRGIYGPGYQERRRERLKQNYGIDVPETFPPASPPLGEGLKAPGLDATARDIAVAECLAGINDIASEIGEQAHKATSHDQRTYNETLKALKDQLQKVRSDIAPRRKFAFRATATSTSDASECARPQDGSTPVTEERLKRVAARTPDSSSGEYEKVPTPYANLQNVLRTERNLDTADRGVFIAMAGPINGAAHITGLNNSTIAVSCRQLRMHHCLNSIVYVRCGSNPVIENCSRMRFAPLPNDVVVAPLTGIGPGCWNLINDFNWLKGGQSPNWSTLGPEDRNTAQTWERVSEIGNDEEVEEVLPLFGVANA